MTEHVDDIDELLSDASRSWSVRRWLAVAIYRRPSEVGRFEAVGAAAGLFLLSWVGLTVVLLAGATYAVVTGQTTLAALLAAVQSSSGPVQVSPVETVGQLLVFVAQVPLVLGFVVFGKLLAALGGTS
jgi:hypothetical protein